MRLFESRPTLRWLAPVAFLAVVTGSGLVAVTATAELKLPARTAEQLLVDLQSAEVDGLSGTVVQTANLGIGEIPVSEGESADLQSLVSGTHTLRVWHSAPDKSRVAVLGTFGESDVITNGREVWLWSSDEKSATRVVLPEGGAPADGARRPDGSLPDLPKTPEEAAERVLEAVGPTTEVRTDSDVEVAGRAAYELVVAPKDDRSLVREVRLALDGEEFVPLRVRVFAEGAEPVFEVSFTDVEFSRPDDAQFEFNPPPGTTVEEVRPPAGAAREQARERAQARGQDRGPADAEVVGEGWTSVVVAKVGTDVEDGELGAFLGELPEVSGSWGSGRLLEGTAFSAVLTDDGRVAAGAVAPELLYEALGR